MKSLFDEVSHTCSKVTTRAYSTSFSLGIYCLHRKLHTPIYSIYGFVRLADEIVDSFHQYDKPALLKEFKDETDKAIERKISLNPILNSFQEVVNTYGIEQELIDSFLNSMEQDLYKSTHNTYSYTKYIFGSAEVVGLMCLRVFTQNSEDNYQRLKPAAMSLGSAFQKVNFLRDLKADYQTLGRVYFPDVDMKQFSDAEKVKIEEDIENDFTAALQGIRQLPDSCRFGVYVAHVYYKSLFNKIKSVSPEGVMTERIRVPNYEKIRMLAGSFLKYRLGIL